MEHVLSVPNGYPYGVLGLRGFRDKDEVDKRYEQFVSLINPDKCKHPRAKETFASK